ncbi:MAG: hypothetical protein QM742_12465 [Aquabacterium sp.]
MRHANTPSTDRQAPHAGKVENDHNKQGQQSATQVHESKRTPQSRHDRETHIGSDNQNQVRRGPGPAR